MLEIRTRWIVKNDLKKIAEVDKECFGNRKSGEPFINSFWNGPDLIHYLSGDNRYGVVAHTLQKDPLSFTFFENFLGCVLYKIDDGLWGRCLDKIIVDCGCRRKGVGTCLLNVLKLSGDKSSPINTVVSEYNLAGQLFLKSNGFKKVGSTIKNLIINSILDDGVGPDGYLMAYTPSVTKAEIPLDLSNRFSGV